MELLTRNNFEGWMQKLMERLDRQDELLLLAMKAEGKQPTITESIRLFDNQDLCMLLQISKPVLISPALILQTSIRFSIDEPSSLDVGHSVCLTS